MWLFELFERWYDRLEERQAQRHALEHELMSRGNPYLKGDLVVRFDHVGRKHDNAR